MDVKKKAHELKKRAKELGYEIKLTHAQELVACILGHETRHSCLKMSNTEKKTTPSNQEERFNLEKVIKERVDGILDNFEMYYPRLQCIKDYVSSYILMEDQIRNIVERDQNVHEELKNKIEKILLDTLDIENLHYYCEECDEHWSDSFDLSYGEVDDECPHCGKKFSPFTSKKKCEDMIYVTKIKHR